MGFFSSAKYPISEHPLTELEVRRLVTYLHIPSLRGDGRKEKMVQDTILARRYSDGKISLQQIFELLTKMKGAGEISKYERDETMAVLKTFFAEHFPK